MYHCGFTYREAYDLPVAYKRWWIERTSRELAKTTEEGATMSRGLHANTPDVRAAQGRQRTNVPARLRRFS
jgi:hypothetical protein